jgi:transposase-like protein
MNSYAISWLHYNRLDVKCNLLIAYIFRRPTCAKNTLDGSRASYQATAESKAEGILPAQTLVRTNRSLNNMIEQNHRKVKQRCYPMSGFKIFGNAEVTLSGIELANKIKKGQFDTSEITGPGAMTLQIWGAARDA